MSFFWQPYYQNNGGVFQVEYIGAGAAVERATTGTLTPAVHSSTLAGDIVIIQATISSAAGVVSDPTTRGNFSQIAQAQIGSSDSGAHYIGWRYAVAGDAGNTITVSYSTDGTVVKCARAYTFRNAALSSPIENVNSAAITNATVSDVNTTTSLNLSMALNFIAVNNDNPIIAYGSETGGNWVLGDQFQTTSGNDASIGFQYCQMPTAGTIGNGSYTQAASNPTSIVGFSIKSRL